MQLTTKAQCVAAFKALLWTLPAGAKDNTKCCDGADLPYGCTYRTDNDFVLFNGNTNSPASYAGGGWRAVCSNVQPNVSQTFAVTVAKGAGGEVVIQGNGTQLCVDNDA